MSVRKLSDLEVLICDDDDMILKIMTHILSEMGIKFVKTTLNPETALLLIREPVNKPFDLFIRDWMMPEMSGIDVLEKLRKADNQLPFVMLTSNATPQAVKEARDRGVTAFIAKPFTANEVQRKITTLASRILR